MPSSLIPRREEDPSTKLNSALLRSSDYALDVGLYDTSDVFSRVACRRFIGFKAVTMHRMSVVLTHQLCFHALLVAHRRDSIVPAAFICTPRC